MDFGEGIVWSGTRRLRWNELGIREGSYHAALVAAETVPGLRIVAHQHDFFEMMFVLEGEGYHLIASPREAPQTERLTTGDLAFLRPDDCHSLVVAPGKRLHWINIAFPAAAWELFRIAADLSPSEWDTAVRPRSVHLAHRESQTACTTLFQSVLQRFQAGRASPGTATPGRLELCAFLAGAVQFLHCNESSEGATGNRRRASLADTSLSHLATRNRPGGGRRNQRGTTRGSCRSKSVSSGPNTQSCDGSHPYRVGQ